APRGGVACVSVVTAGEAAGDGGARGRADLRACAGPAARDRGREPVMRRWRPLIACLMAATAVALVVARARGQAPEAAFVVGGVQAVAEPRLAGLQWRFVRV